MGNKSKDKKAIIIKITIMMIFISSFVSNNTAFSYLFSALLLFFSCCIMGLDKSFLKPISILFSLFLLILQLFYFLLGIINEAPLFDALRNFSGFYLFPCFIIIFSSIRKCDLDLTKLVFLSFIISLPFLLYFYVSSSSFIVGDKAHEISEMRRMYSISSFIICGYLWIFVYDFLKKYQYDLGASKKVSLLLSVSLLSSISVILSFSKIVIALLIFLFLIILMRYFFVTVLFLIILFFAFGDFQDISQHTSFLSSGYSIMSPGNIIRVEQAKNLFSELSLFGSGLGVPLSSFSRRTQSYGFELSYLNIIHKYGLFSVVYLWLFFYPAVIVFFRYCCRSIREYDKVIILVFPLLLSSFFNPVISHPVVILLVSYWWSNYFEGTSCLYSLNDVKQSLRI